jgi:hypothetical protein
VNCYFKIADGMTACQVANRISGQKKNDSRFAGNITKQVQRTLLIGR